MRHLAKRMFFFRRLETKLFQCDWRLTFGNLKNAHTTLIYANCVRFQKRLEIKIFQVYIFGFFFLFLLSENSGTIEVFNIER